MISGHFATALLANQSYPKGTLSFFLFVSQFQDFMWFILHYLGLEPTTPTDVFDATIVNMSVNMMYSHHALPQLFWGISIFFLGKLLFKSTQIGLVALALFFGHFLLDIVSGHAHHLFGQETAQISFGWYATHVYLAILIEALFTAIVLYYYFMAESRMGIKRTIKNKALLIGVFVYGLLFLLSVAEVSFRDLFAIPPIDLGFGTTIPTILLTYLTMSLSLLYAVPQRAYETVK